MPPKTEYSLADFGRTLAPIIEAMQQWGQTHLNIAGCEERERYWNKVQVNRESN